MLCSLNNFHLQLGYNVTLLHVCFLSLQTSLESFPAPEIPRSVFENLKVVAARRQHLLLENEYLQNEVQHLHMGNEYIQILLENVRHFANYCKYLIFI